MTTPLPAQPIVVNGSCHHDCPDTCMWEVTVDSGRAVKLRGSSDHAYTNGQLCPKVNRFLDRVYHPDRLLTPLRRVGPKGAGEFEPITWETALDDIGRRLGPMIDQQRGASILQSSFAGTQGMVQMGVTADRFFDAIGASDLTRHLCGVTSNVAATDVLGDPLGMDPQDLAYSGFIVLWGTDTLTTNRHLWPTIERARSRGAEVVVIDPFKTTTASRADHWIAIKPGTDVALVLAMVRLMDAEGLLDQEWLDGFTSGWPQLRQSAEAWTPERAAEHTGVPVQQIEWLARTFGSTPNAAVRTLIGPEHRSQGREILRAVTMLPALTGAWRHRGGGLARSTHRYFFACLNLDTDRPARRAFPQAALGEILNDPALDPPIEALVVHNSNPAVMVPDQNRVVEGLRRHDLFTVVIEQFLTDTARYADIVLPTTTQIEHLDLGTSWGHLDLSLNRPAIAPVGLSKPNTEIFRLLARRLDLDDDRLQMSDEDVIRELLDSGHPWLEGITFEALESNDWMRLRVPTEQRLYVDTPAATADGKLRLGALRVEHGVESPEASPELAARYPLRMMSRRRQTAFLNANYGAFPEHQGGPAGPRLEIHPDDAQARDLASGDHAVVFNDRGRLTLAVEVTETTQPGLVGVPWGWWHRSSPENRAVNALTNPALPDDGIGSAFFQENLVEVEAVRSNEPATG